jgi:diaminohydroxyphosphoribosylaminopyrimidine deaminase / 5-amino-6-(5-phosphoribosylamino)uracil reductase
MVDLFAHHKPEILSLLEKLSFTSMGLSSPNPSVACVITDLKYNILSFGSTDKHGGVHAERNAYNRLTVPVENEHYTFVTLEPCTHYGKTPPCLNLILKNKPKTLFYGMRDPNPQVSQRDGLAQCESLGISVVHDQQITEIAKVYLAPFFERIFSKRPVRWIKTAISREGYYCRLDKRQTSISTEISQLFTMLLRAKVDAVVVGHGTTFFDTPSLDFRRPAFSKTNFALLRDRVFKGNTFSHPDKFFHQLFFSAIEEERIEYERLSEYQPFRVFLVDGKNSNIDTLIQKQKEINQQHKSQKCVFFILPTGNSASHQYPDKTLYAKLAEISFLDPIYISDLENIGKQISDTLHAIGCNTILIEGGNFLYRTFSKNFQQEDRVIVIQSQTILEAGYKPDIDFQNLELSFTENISTDIWKVYRNR